jgi:inner membrane protein YidH
MNDSQLANDRTFLAWLRTGIALFGLGFVVAKVSFLVQPDATGVSDRALYTSIGVLVVLCGGALIAVGYSQHAKVARALNVDEQEPLPKWSRTIAVSAVGAALVLSTLIVITT